MYTGCIIKNAYVNSSMSTSNLIDLKQSSK